MKSIRLADARNKYLQIAMNLAAPGRTAFNGGAFEALDGVTRGDIVTPSDVALAAVHRQYVPAQYRDTHTHAQAKVAALEET